MPLAEDRPDPTHRTRDLAIPRELGWTFKLPLAEDLAIPRELGRAFELPLAQGR